MSAIEIFGAACFLFGAAAGWILSRAVQSDARRNAREAYEAGALEARRVDAERSIAAKNVTRILRERIAEQDMRRATTEVQS